MVLGISVINAERPRAVGYDLKQAAGHDQVLDEMERLIGISKVGMKESCRREAEQGEDHGGIRAPDNL